MLGANGAGKSTLLKILSMLLKADAGTVSVHGFDVAAQAAGDGLRRFRRRRYSRTPPPAGASTTTPSSPLRLFCCIRGSGPPWEGGFVAAEVQHGQGDQGLG